MESADDFPPVEKMRYIGFELERDEKESCNRNTERRLPNLPDRREIAQIGPVAVYSPATADSAADPHEKYPPT